MKGKDEYFITIKRGLLEDKHRLAMQVSQKTTALWMYLWLIDRVTSIDPDTKLGTVLYGVPQKLEGFARELRTDRKTANKMFQALKKHGYIETIRTPHGQIVFVTKAFKIFGQKVPSDNKLEFVETIGSEHSDVPKSGTSQSESGTSLGQNLVHHSEQMTTPVIDRSESGTSNYNNIINNKYVTNNHVKSDKPITQKNENKVLFNELVQVLGFSDQVKATPGRMAKLKSRLKTFAAEDLLKVAASIAADPYIQGDNPGGKRYGTIDYLLRSDEKVDEWLHTRGNKLNNYKADW